jgi:hypothetical protein
LELELLFHQTDYPVVSKASGKKWQLTVETYGAIHDKGRALYWDTAFVMA